MSWQRHTLIKSLPPISQRRLVTILAAETSCDDTALCLMEDGQILYQNVWRQHDIHAKTNGIVPRIAATLHAERLPHMLRDATSATGLDVGKIDLLCATRGPGMGECLQVGHEFVKNLSLHHGKPFYSINHLEAHLLAIGITQSLPKFPFIALILSGGHTELILCNGLGDYTTLCTTLDDTIGEAIDKAARILGFPYDERDGPLAKMLEQLNSIKDTVKATTRNSIDDNTSDGMKEWKIKPISSSPRKIHNVPKSYSFSGLKESLRRSRNQSIDEGKWDASSIALANRALRFIQDCSRQLIASLEHAYSSLSLPTKTVLVCGGVARNDFVLQSIEDAGWQVLTPAKPYCTDNAAMIAYVAYIYWKNQQSYARFHNIISKWAVDDIKLFRQDGLDKCDYRH